MQPPKIKVYIAGPMTGLPEFNYPAFRAAKTHLEEFGYEVLSPHTIGDEFGQEEAWTFYMKKALIMMLQADAIAVLSDPLHSRGAITEVWLGQLVGIKAYVLGSFIRVN